MVLCLKHIRIKICAVSHLFCISLTIHSSIRLLSKQSQQHSINTHLFFLSYWKRSIEIIKFINYPHFFSPEFAKQFVLDDFAIHRFILSSQPKFVITVFISDFILVWKRWSHLTTVLCLLRLCMCVCVCIHFNICSSQMRSWRVYIIKRYPPSNNLRMSINILLFNATVCVKIIASKWDSFWFAFQIT